MNTRLQIDVFLKSLTEFVNSRIDPQHHEAATFSVEFGRKYAKIIQGRHYGGRSVYCFVDLENGDILKAATWKAPAPRGKRGSIFAADNGISCCDTFGLKYLI